MLNIVTLLLEFVPCCPMYLFHHVRCIGVSSDSMLFKPTKKKKCMTSWQDKSLLVCVWSSLSACSLLFSLSIFSPHIPPSVQQSQASAFPFHFCFDLLLHWSFETRENKGSFLCCVWTFLLMQVSAVVFRPTSEPLAAPEGRSHTLPWRLRDSEGSLSLSQNRGLTNPYFWQLSDLCIYRRLKVRRGKQKHLPKGDCILEIYYFIH